MLARWHTMFAARSQHRYRRGPGLTPRSFSAGRFASFRMWESRASQAAMRELASEYHKFSALIWLPLAFRYSARIRVERHCLQKWLSVVCSEAHSAAYSTLYGMRISGCFCVLLNAYYHYIKSPVLTNPHSSQSKYWLGLGPSQNPHVCNLRFKFHFLLHLSSSSLARTRT